jgi:hypothetical protein
VTGGWATGAVQGSPVLANAWKETVRDAVADIRANREAAKVSVRRAITKPTSDPTEWRRLYTLLTCDQWMDDPYLSRKMRHQWARGHNRTHNQIIIRSDNVRTFTLTQGEHLAVRPGTAAPHVGAGRTEHERGTLGDAPADPGIEPGRSPLPDRRRRHSLIEAAVR